MKKEPIIWDGDESPEWSEEQIQDFIEQYRKYPDNTK